MVRLKLKMTRTLKFAIIWHHYPQHSHMLPLHQDDIGGIHHSQMVGLWQPERSLPLMEASREAERAIEKLSNVCCLHIKHIFQYISMDPSSRNQHNHHYFQSTQLSRASLLKQTTAPGLLWTAAPRFNPHVDGRSSLSRHCEVSEGCPGELAEKLSTVGASIFGSL